MLFSGRGLGPRTKAARQTFLYVPLPVFAAHLALPVFAAHLALPVFAAHLALLPVVNVSRNVVASRKSSRRRKSSRPTANLRDLPQICLSIQIRPKEH